MTEIGERVGAILCAKGDEVQFLGFGTYEGNFVPEKAAGPMAAALCEANVPNPCIRLDSGKTVYGCECWWGPSQTVQRMLDKYRVVTEVDIDEVRHAAD